MRLHYAFFFVWSFGQQRTTIDSLLAVLPKQPDTAKVLTYAKLCYEVAKTNQDKALQYGQTGLALSRRIGYKRGQYENLHKIGISYGR